MLNVLGQINLQYNTIVTESNVIWIVVIWTVVNWTDVIWTVVIWTVAIWTVVIWTIVIWTTHYAWFMKQQQETGF